MTVDSSSLMVSSDDEDETDESAVSSDDDDETDESEAELDSTVMWVCVGEYWGLS